jgi:transposase-like protein
METRKSTRKFKLEAVRLIEHRGVSYVQASRRLNVHPWLSDNPQHDRLR